MYIVFKLFFKVHYIEPMRIYSLDTDVSHIYIVHVPKHSFFLVSPHQYRKLSSLKIA